LEIAPRTSLRADSALERWEGFWCVSDEGYYVRCVRSDNSEQWYRVADEVAHEITGARVLPFRRRMVTQDARQMLLVSRPGQRPILVGTSRRRQRQRGGVGVTR
jgi:hypothetical protein